MNNRTKKFVLFLAFCAIFFGASLAHAQEKIDNFDATIKINTDSSINVSEKIDYNFGDLQKHGIFRDIPIKYDARGGNFTLLISNISVADQIGTPYQFTTSYPGNNIEIKIGNANQFVTGQKTYIINYTIQHAINYFSDHDELYWNITGNGWTIPIKKSSAAIILPTTLAQEKIQAACFADALGSQNACSLIQKLPDNQGNVRQINFEQDELAANEGLTIVIGLPKGILTQPTAWQNILATIQDNWILALPLLTFIIMFYLWYTRGRDPKGRGTIIAQYEAPNNLTPAQIGSLIDEKLDAKDISAEIVFLATTGYLKITRTENKGLIFKHEDYLLEKLKDANDLPPFDISIMRGLFSAGEKSVKLSDLKNEFYKEIPDIKDKTFDSLVSQGYFPGKPSKTQAKYTIIGIVILFGAIFFANIIGSIIGGLAIGSLVVSAIIIVIFGLAMPVKTVKGVETKENILGLKEYLQVAEKDRIKFFNAPAKNPEHFEKLLPYAMVLGVEQEWAKQFEGIYNQSPSWYSDPSGGAFNALILVHSLNNFNHSANAALAMPRNAAGGGSGFGGGGFSGGGFGGGGGGSW